MQLSKGFFDLNLQFAQRIAQVTGRPFADCLLDYTHLYPRFGLGRGFDPNNPVWQAYWQGLQQAEDGGAWTYAFYRQRMTEAPPSAPAPAFGCFSYAVWSDNRIRLHFHNADASEDGPLSRLRFGTRLDELRVMFAHIRQTVIAPGNVVGGSWLYNLEAYRRLFPPAFIATAHVEQDLEAQFIALWGQFVDRHGAIKADLASRFLRCLQNSTKLEDMLHCFPYRVLRLEAPIRYFYEFYTV
ncbi:MAG: hypothetical protein U0350_17995 [Caldilineaceae bacterium]